ncbi:MAG: 3-dehydroquinate synthase, partial [Candidatus Omnitrophica bacterium]|nr:3-dehydroquinate synthase [Candidatus Omnitrophota bacterium]
VGDLTGFIAATYKRGIPYIQIPTTLLAQVDSAIGGKTAIDLPAGKNLLGAFYQPRMVYSDINVLKSLPRRHIKSGLAEVVKYGVIFDKNLFEYLEKNHADLLEGNPDCLSHVIAAASRIKAHVVSVDEHETTGFRTILNFGHTIGHAVETATGYTRLAHGEAISIGMACAADIAVELGLFAPESFARLISLLERLQLPVQAKEIDLRAVFSAFYRDKKFIRGAIRMVLPTKIGHVIVTENIPWTIVNNAIKKRVNNYGH